MLKIGFGLLILLLIPSCTNYVEINNSLDVMKSLVVKSQMNHALVSEKYLQEIENLKYVIESNTAFKVSVIEKDSSLSVEEKISQIKSAYEKADSQKGVLQEKLKKTRIVLDKQTGNFLDYYAINDALKEYLDLVERKSPSSMVEKELKSMDLGSKLGEFLNERRESK